MHSQLLYRKCIVCGVKKPRKNMYRLVISNSEQCVVDRVGNLQGRGAYLCDDSKCKASTQLVKRAKYALRTHVELENSEDLKLLR